VAITGKGARTRQRIVRCAADILAERGVHATNLADVVKAASVTKGALYFHFASKDELLLGIEFEYHADSRRMLAELETDPDPLRRLVRLGFALSRRQLTYPLAMAHNRLLLEQIAPSLQALLPFPPVDWKVVIGAWLDQARAQSMLAPGLDLPALAELLDDCLIGVITGGQVETRTVALLERMAVLWRSFVLPGLVADPDHLAALNRLVDEQARAGADPAGCGADQAHRVAPGASAQAPASERPASRTLETAG
jgi:AcrR family transcriptional regulator